MLTGVDPRSSSRRRHFPPGRRWKWFLGILGYALGIFLFQILHKNLESTPSALFMDEQPDCPLQTASKTGSSLNAPMSFEPTRKWAYVFLISGCDPESPLTYRPYLWNILVASKNLVESNSQADVVIMVQFARPLPNATEARTNELPQGDLQWLSIMDDDNRIRLRYLPPLIRDNFYNAQLAKFHILELTMYSRVMYLDADVMPLCSLDYLFELSETGQLQPNVVLAWFTEPSHGGMFLLEPGNYHEWEKVVERREKEALELPYPHWDPIKGWGRVLTEEWYGLPQPLTMSNGTRAYSSPRHSTNWTFHGDFADQGLLYFWTRFHRQAVSILYLDKVVDFGMAGQVVKTRAAETVFGDPSTGKSHSCLPRGKEYPGQYGSTLQDPLFLGKVPHRDFCHFSGEGKPWEEKRNALPKAKNELKSSTDYWYFQLGKIFETYEDRYPKRKLPSLPLKYKKPVLGRYPRHRSMIGSIHKRQKKRLQNGDLSR